jgi:hypothetical protein
MLTFDQFTLWLALEAQVALLAWGLHLQAASCDRRPVLRSGGPAMIDRLLEVAWFTLLIIFGAPAVALPCRELRARLDARLHRTCNQTFGIVSAAYGQAEREKSALLEQHKKLVGEVAELKGCLETMKRRDAFFMSTMSQAAERLERYGDADLLTTLDRLLAKVDAKEQAHG